MKKLLTYLGWPLVVVPTLLYYLGSAMNIIVIAANKGLMPVDTAECFAANVPIGAALDADQGGNHVCMSAASHLKWLADWIWVGNGTASLGDLGIYTGLALQEPLFWVWMTLLLYCVATHKDFWLE